MPKDAPHLNANFLHPRILWLSLHSSHTPSSAQLQKKADRPKGAGQIIATLIILSQYHASPPPSPPKQDCARNWGAWGAGIEDSLFDPQNFNAVASDANTVRL